jgi:DNA-binding MarR family transcriptional regulator
MGALRQEDYERLAAFRSHLRRFLRFSERAAASLGVPSQQYQALLAIKAVSRAERMTIGDLAEELQIQHHSAVELVDRLVAHQFVRREAGADRRSVQVVLTEPGEAMLEQLALIHQEELRRIGPLLKLVLEQLSVEDAGAA